MHPFSLLRLRDSVCRLPLTDPIGTPLLYLYVMRMHKPVLEAFRRRELTGAARVSLAELRAQSDPYRDAASWQKRSKFRVTMQQHQPGSAVGTALVGEAGTRVRSFKALANRRLYYQWLKQRRARRSAGWSRNGRPQDMLVSLHKKCITWATHEDAVVPACMLWFNPNSKCNLVEVS